MSNLTINDKNTLREQARQNIESGAVTQDYQLSVDESVEVLNEALATEIVCFLRYTHHYFMATGIHSSQVAAEFLEHANEEQQHAMKLAERIQELGGKPDFNPDTLTSRSHAEFREGASLTDMIRENLIAERIAIVAYRKGIEYFGDKDPTSRRLLEAILEQEEEHASDLNSFLLSFNQANNVQPQQANKPEERKSAKV